MDYPENIFLHEQDEDFSCVDGPEKIKYIRSDIHGERMRVAIAEREYARKETDALQVAQTKHLEVIAILAGAANVSPAELVQLGVGTVVQNPNWKDGDKARDRYVFSVFDLNDLKDMSEAKMHNQATTAKFRQIKQHFQRHQKAVSFVLDQMQILMGKNRITSKDRDDLRDLRDKLSELTGRRV